MDADDLFARMLRERGLDPEAIPSAAAAWEVFCEYVQVEVDGIAPRERDGDGFIVQWGMYDLSGSGRPAPVLTISRQFAVVDHADPADEDEWWQPQYWVVELELRFAEDSPWGALDETAWHNTGFDFEPIGPERTRVLAETIEFIGELPQVVAMWAATPVSSAVRLVQLD